MMRFSLAGANLSCTLDKPGTLSPRLRAALACYFTICGAPLCGIWSAQESAK
jgi:hypothetical protein